MRESRTYGSGRGACDETRVPTATAPRVHHAARRRGGGVAARGARVTLIDLDPDRLDDGAPFIDFRFEESLKFTGRRAHDHVAGLFQLAFDHGIGESCDGIDTHFP